MRRDDCLEVSAEGWSCNRPWDPRDGFVAYEDGKACAMGSATWIALKTEQADFKLAR